jgi:hypothetical protein
MVIEEELKKIYKPTVIYSEKLLVSHGQCRSSKSRSDNGDNAG